LGKKGNGGGGGGGADAAAETALKGERGAHVDADSAEVEARSS